MQYTEASLREIMESLVASGASMEEVVMGFSTAAIKKADVELKKMRRYYQRKRYEDRLKGTEEWRLRRQRITNNYRNRKKWVDVTEEML